VVLIIIYFPRKWCRKKLCTRGFTVRATLVRVHFPLVKKSSLHTCCIFLNFSLNVFCFSFVLVVSSVAVTQHPVHISHRRQINLMENRTEKRSKWRGCAKTPTCAAEGWAASTFGGRRRRSDMTVQCELLRANNHRQVLCGTIKAPSVSYATTRYDSTCHNFYCTLYDFSPSEEKWFATSSSPLTETGKRRVLIAACTFHTQTVSPWSVHRSRLGLHALFRSI
jgi:hypothetical protein